MRGALDAVDGDGFQSAQLFEFGIFDKVHVGQIGDISEAVTENRERLLLVMPALDRDDFYFRDWAFNCGTLIVITLSRNPYEGGLRCV